MCIYIYIYTCVILVDLLQSFMILVSSCLFIYFALFVHFFQRFLLLFLYICIHIYIYIHTYIDIDIDKSMFVHSYSCLDSRFRVQGLEFRMGFKPKDKGIVFCG